MIIEKGFEALIQVGGGLNANNVEYLEMNEILNKAEEIHRGWKDYNIDNSEFPNFDLTENQKISFTDINGKKMEMDITVDAFSQLCGRMNTSLKTYTLSCFKETNDEMTTLAVENFKRWRSKCTSQLKFRTNEGIIRAVVGSKYVPCSTFKVFETLNRTYDKGRFKPVGAYVSADKSVLRMVDFDNPLKVNSDNSPIFQGIAISNGETGNSSWTMKMFNLRQICSNGMLVKDGGGILHREYHVGDISDGKSGIFHKAFATVDKYKDNLEYMIDNSAKNMLSAEMLRAMLSDASKKLKMSQKTEESMMQLVGQYGQTEWGFINAITAQAFTLDTRMEYEQYGGGLLVRGNKR